MGVILDGAKAESRLVFINDGLLKKAYRGLFVQGRQAIPHPVERGSTQPLIAHFIREQLPTLNECLEPQEDRKSTHMDFTTEGRAPSDCDLFHTETSNGALTNAATLAMLTPEMRFPNKACTTSETTSFRLNKRELFSANLIISLTTIESLLLKQLVLSHRRVCSKQELILAINRDPSSYTGLEMCLSRLQGKFNNAYGERLFRSVRNRGYCLVQDVKATPPMSTGKK